MDIEKAFNTNIVKKGHFKLSSGLHSDTYVQAQELLSEPFAVEFLAERIIEKLKNAMYIDCVLSPAVGAIIIGYEVAKKLGVSFYFTERENGKLTLRRGQNLPAGSRVLIIEDVITTGGTAFELEKLAIENHCLVDSIGCIVDRSRINEIVSVEKIEATIWNPNLDCELCLKGIPLETPGSKYKEK